LHRDGRRIPPGAKIPPDIRAAYAKRGVFCNGGPIFRWGIGIGDKHASKVGFPPKPDLTAHHAGDTAIRRPMEIKREGVGERGIAFRGFEDLSGFGRKTVK